MIGPIEVEPRERSRIWLQFSDGAFGEVDLSHLTGRGVFAAWNEPGYFDKVYIASDRAIAWGDELELCQDALHIQLTGKSFDEVPVDIESPAHDV